MKTPTVVFLSLFYLAVLFVGSPRSQSIPTPDSKREISGAGIPSELLTQWDLSKKAPQRQSLLNPQKVVRVIYLVPSDKVARPDYINALSASYTHIRGFYRNAMGDGLSFNLAQPIVSVYSLPQPASYYSTHQSGPNSPQWLWFYENIVMAGFGLTGGGFNDPNNRWIFHIDADAGCGQILGGTQGVAAMAANDFRGLVGEQNVPACQNEPPDNGGPFRWTGGQAHELGHSFDLPHPAGCGSPSGCAGGTTAANSLMWLGYSTYPNTYLLTSDKETLLNSQFFSVSIAGRATTAFGRGIGLAKITLTSTYGSKVAYTNTFGYYKFPVVSDETIYSITVSSRRYVFAPNVIAVTTSGNLDGVNFVGQ